MKMADVCVTLSSRECHRTDDALLQTDVGSINVVCECSAVATKGVSMSLAKAAT